MKTKRDLTPVAVLTAFVVFAGWVWLASGCTAHGADRRLPPAAVVNRSPKPAVPPRLIGWDVPQPDGSVLFVPVQPAPAGPLTIPAEAPPRPFVPPPVVPGGSTAHMTAPSVGVPNTSLPVPVPFRVPTGMYALPGIPGGINGCTSYG